MPSSSITADRCFAALRLLREWRTRRQLAEALGCSQKEISRDLLALQRLGFDLPHRVQARGLRQWRVRNVRRTLIQLTNC